MIKTIYAFDDFGRKVPIGTYLKPDPIGGKIFYIDQSADGDYIFYNNLGTQVPAPTVGTDCTGWTYISTGATKDKYYVFHDNLYLSKKWANEYVDLFHWNYSSEFGTGKSNTEICMSYDNGKYAKDNTTIWGVLSEIRESKLNGCDDWFIGSRPEMENLRLSNLTDWFLTNIWSSSQTSLYGAWYYNPQYGWYLDDAYKQKNMNFCIMRSI